MSGKTVFWLDEEENAAFPEMVQLRFHQVQIDYMTDVDRALDRILSAEFKPDLYSACIIDAHMPMYGDPRFREGGIHESLAGVKLCEYIVNHHPDIWRSIKSKTLIYTMLPPSPRVEAVQRFAHTNGAQFVHKAYDGELYSRLHDLQWI